MTPENVTQLNEKMMGWHWINEADWEGEEEENNLGPQKLNNTIRGCIRSPDWLFTQHNTSALS